MNKNELLAGTAADNCNTAESGSSASLEENRMLSEGRAISNKT